MLSNNLTEIVDQFQKKDFLINIYDEINGVDRETEFYTKYTSDLNDLSSMINLKYHDDPEAFKKLMRDIFTPRYFRNIIHTETYKIVDAWKEQYDREASRNRKPKVTFELGIYFEDILIEMHKWYENFKDCNNLNYDLGKLLQNQKELRISYLLDLFFKGLTHNLDNKYCFPDITGVFNKYTSPIYGQGISSRTNLMEVLAKCATTNIEFDTPKDYLMGEENNPDVQKYEMENMEKMYLYMKNILEKYKDTDNYDNLDELLQQVVESDPTESYDLDADQIKSIYEKRVEIIKDVLSLLILWNFLLVEYEENYYLRKTLEINY